MFRSKRWALHITTLATLAACLTTSVARATSTEIGPTDDLRAAVNALTPGDELVLRGGLYVLTFRFSIGVSGTLGAPILIRAKAGEVPHLTRDAAQNTINIEGVRHLIVRGLEVSGGSHGIRLTDASFVTIEDCHVHDTGDVGISANVPGSVYEEIALLRNHVHHTGGTGEGFYLGCNNGGCTMFNSIVDGNHVHDTIVGTSQGDGIELKQGSYGNTVSGNLIHDTRYPCILVYGTAGNAVNVIERNTMWGCGDHGIQVAADAVVRNNVILGALADGIHSQIHQGAVPANLSIVHNTVLNSGDTIRLSDIAGPILIANNAVYSGSGMAIRAAGSIAMVTATGNIGTGGTVGIGSGYNPGGNRSRDFIDAANQNVYLASGSALIAAGDPTQVTVVDRDFNNRNGIADVGAYRFATSCVVNNLVQSTTLRVAPSGVAALQFSWVGDGAASEHHLNGVFDKFQIAGSGAKRPPAGSGIDVCTAATPSCVTPRPNESQVFYQAFGACGAGGSEEGP